MRVLIGTGHEKIDKALYDRIRRKTKFNLVEGFIYYKEAANDVIQDEDVDIFITSDFLDGTSFSNERLVQEVRSRNPKTRIIFLMNRIENKTKFSRFLYSLSVFDVINIEDGLSLNEVIDHIKNPRGWIDVYQQFESLSSKDIYALNKEVFESEKDVSIGEKKYDKFQLEVEDEKEVLFQTVSFWSARAQSGSTFLATNTALLLSQHENSKVLLVDLNIDNPNVHVHMSLDLADDNKNLTALIEDFKNQKVNSLKEIGDYFTPHPFHPNLDILIGAFYVDFFYDGEALLTLLTHIEDYADRAGYTSVIYDTPPGLNTQVSNFVNREVDKVIMPFLESPGSIVGLRKFFSANGPFLTSLLNKNKVFPILNQSTKTSSTQKLSELASNSIERSVYAHIPRKEEIHHNIANGIPILNRKPSPALKREFIKIANCIHSAFKVEGTLSKGDRGHKRRRGLFGGR